MAKERNKGRLPSGSLVFISHLQRGEARSFIKKLKNASLTEFKSKDIFRASSLPLLKGTNSDVKKDQARIKSRKQLSPLLLVRDTGLGKLVIADGYHRLCAVYTFDEEAMIACKIV